MEATVRIGEFADRVGVTAKTIRHYDELRLVPPPPRSEGGYRLYSGQPPSGCVRETIGRRLEGDRSQGGRPPED